MSIRRFANNDDCVEVFIKNARKKELLKSDNGIFCAMRTWNQSAESGYMKQIEDEYQKFSSALLKNSTRTLSISENRIISKMFALWNCRWHWDRKKISNQRIEGTLGLAFNSTKDDRELLEKNGINTIYESDGDFLKSSRDLISPQILMNIQSVTNELNSWLLTESSHGQFIFPDNSKNIDILPLSPTQCFIHGYTERKISLKDLIHINQNSILTSEKYYFAKNINECPT